MTGTTLLLLCLLVLLLLAVVLLVRHLGKAAIPQPPAPPVYEPGPAVTLPARAGSGQIGARPHPKAERLRSMSPGVIALAPTTTPETSSPLTDPFSPLNPLSPIAVAQWSTPPEPVPACEPERVTFSTPDTGSGSDGGASSSSECSSSSSDSSSSSSSGDW